MGGGTSVNLLPCGGPKFVYVPRHRLAMRALVLSPRFPWPAYSGDRLRATIWLSALARHAEVTLVAPWGEVPGDSPRFHFSPAPRSWKRSLLGVLAAIRDGLPLQCLLAAPYD